MSVNEHTGDSLRTKPVTDEFASGWEGIWGKAKEPEKLTTCTKCPRDETKYCNYCGLRQVDQTFATWVDILKGNEWQAK